MKTVKLKLDKKDGTYQGEDDRGNRYTIALNKDGKPKKLEIVKAVRLETYYGT